MEAHRHQLSQQVQRRMHKQLALFLGPASQPGSVHFFGDGNASVLVHRYKPVSIARFLKVGALHCDGIETDERLQR
jgi:hypothetical protein